MIVELTRQGRRLGLCIIAQARAFLAVSTLAALAISQPAVAQTPTPIDVGGGTPANAMAAADGYIVGYTQTSSGAVHAFVWSASTQTMLDLGALIPDSDFSEATSVNSKGEVVGWAIMPDGTPTGFYWSRTTGLVSLGELYPNFGGVPTVLINESGVVALFAATHDAYSLYPKLFRWTFNGGFQNYLGEPGGGNPMPKDDPLPRVITGLSSRGDIFGYINTDFPFIAFGPSGSGGVIQSPQLPDPNPLYRASAVPGILVVTAINGSGLAVGYFSNGFSGYSLDLGSNVTHTYVYPFKWDTNTPFKPDNSLNLTLLGSLSTTGTIQAFPMAVNNSGVIVGYRYLTDSPSSDSEAFIYQGSGPMIALPSLPGAHFSRALAINDDGVITGTSDVVGASAIVWQNGVPQAITPSFAPDLPTVSVSGHTLFGNGGGAMNSFGLTQHAWIMALVPAAPFFTDSLFGPTSPNLSMIFAGKYGYTASGLQRTQSDNGTDRPMVMTGSSGYLTANKFTAEVTVKLVTSDLLFYGVGQGDADADYNNEPSHAFYFRVHNSFDGSSGIQTVVRSTTGSFLATNEIGTYVNGATITLRIVRVDDKVTMSVVGGGSVSYSLSAFPALGLTTSNTRVFFGNTATGSVFSKLTISQALPDTTAPVITAPADIVQEATAPAGNVVTFTATARDDIDGAVNVVASPASGSTFPIATTVVGLAASDRTGNTATASFKVTVQDTTPPAIGLVPTIGAVEATGPNGASVSFTVPSATDLVDGAVAITASPSSGSVFPLGITTVTLSATDAHQNKATKTFGVTVQDTTPPSIGTTPTVAPVEATGPNGALVSFTVPSAMDLVDGPVTVTASPASGSTFPVGTTTVTLTATDAARNSATKSFVVKVQDTTAPVIAAQGNLIAEATSASGAVVTFTPSASDLVSGAVAVSAAPASGSTFPLGTTTVTLTAVDAAGNAASRTFTVTVRDSTPPAITAPANLTTEATSAAGAIVTFSPSATDLVNGAVNVTASPASGSTFPLGTTSVTLTAVDAAGNAATKSFAVKVQDTTAPAVKAPVDVVVEATGLLTSAAIGTATATDAVGVVSLTNNAPAQFPVGVTTVTWTAKDAANNLGTATQRVTIKDTTAPVITKPANSTVNSTSVAGAVVIYTAQATDAVDGPVAVKGSLASGAMFPIGVTTVTLMATDAAGNSSTATFTVTVLSPARQLDNLSAAVASSSVLSASDAQAIGVKLTAAATSLSSGNKNAARGQLGAAVNQLNALVKSNRVSAAQVQPLLDALNLITGQI